MLSSPAMTERLAQAPAAAAEPDTAAGHSRLLDPQLVVIGVVGGLLSGLLGVGGGIVMVPLLVLWACYRQRDAHALSLGAIVPISIGGIVTFGIAGELHWLDAAALAVGAIVGARLGAGLLARIGERPLKMVFGLFLVGVAVAMGLHA